ncbi:MAG: nucleotide exchange factor GrpE [Breznakibacter sp.]
MVKKTSHKHSSQAMEQEQTVNSEETQTADAINQSEEPAQEIKEDELHVDSETETLKQTINELNDKYLRLSAEFDNYRKRTMREKMELTKTAGESILTSILPVVDDFDRALKHMGESDNVEALRDGVVLIYNKFKDYLTQKGVTEIEAINQPFNTDLHEAITKTPAPSPEMKGKILDCMEKGYVLNDKVIRFSKVVVCE